MSAAADYRSVFQRNQTNQPAYRQTGYNQWLRQLGVKKGPMRFQNTSALSILSILDITPAQFVLQPVR